MFFRVMDKARLPDLVSGLQTELRGRRARRARRRLRLRDRSDDPGRLRLDYDTTLLPPKKLFFPPESSR